MENKKRSTLATVLLLIAVLVIGALAGYIYVQKVETDKKIVDLESKISQKQEVKEEISNTKESKIEGRFDSVGTDPHGCTYEFLENKVTYSMFETIKGDYEIVNNKIKIIYTEAFDPEGNVTDFYPNGQIEELIIVDENTLMSKKIIDGELYVGVYVKDTEVNNEDKVEDKKSWKESYIQKLDSEKNRESNDLEIRYYIEDIDNNGIPELLIENYTAEADRNIDVYTYEEDKIVFLGNFGSSQINLYKMNDKDYIFGVYGHMGAEETYKIYINGKSIKKENIGNRQIGADKGYTQGDVLLEKSNIKEKSLIEDYK